MTEDILATLERTMKRYPNHPGANHFYIHTVEAVHPELEEVTVWDITHDGPHHEDRCDGGSG